VDPESAGVASGFSRKAVAVANLWLASRILPAEAGSHTLKIMAESTYCTLADRSRAPVTLLKKM
jgi:hypothetical protein